MGLFDGKVVAITGAGGGLGRAYAQAFAREGAKVVVNDLGGERDGSGDGSRTMAEQVVGEIGEMGGEAVANFASVADEEGAKSIVQSAVDAFGRLDVLVNNAGILRDRTLAKMSLKLWDPVIAVHLTGSYLCARHAARQMIAQGEGGRIINTTSLAGLMGNFGQTNYSAAKAGIAGFTRTAAQELRRSSITVNSIAPIAYTRLTDDIDAITEHAKVEFIAPMVLFLASDLAKDITGRIFGVHSNHIFEYRMEMTRGVDKGDDMWEVAEIAERLGDICRTEAERVKIEAKKGAAAGAAAVDPATKGLRVFEAMITAFRSDKAGDWTAQLHFEIAGCGQYTMTVGDGQVSVAQGHVGAATCVIQMDGETFFGMAEGEVDGTQAFMQGKITASNMGDMVRWGTAFDPKKAQAAVKEALAAMQAGAPAEVDPAAKGLSVFEAMITAFRADKAGDWTARLHFEIGDCGQYTMTVGDGQVSVAQGLTGDASCVVKMDGETFFGMAEGEVDGTQAFMQGKITATNMGDMVRYGTAFDQKKAQAAVKAALAALAGPAPAAAAAEEPAKPARPAGLNRACLGKTYATAPFFVTPAQTIAYAKATNDDNPAYVDESRADGIVAPVLYPVRILYPLLEDAALDPELNADVVMLLHGEQDMRFVEPIRPGDLLEARGEVAYMEKKESGELLDIKTDCYRDGQLVVEATARCFIRSREDKKKAAKPRAEATPPALSFSEPMTVREDQTTDYAEASGDRNPIHTDPEVGKAAGHGGVIAHGLCTMAFASQAVIKHAAGGDPTRLKRLKVRFSKPVRPGETVITEAWKTGEAEGVVEYGFRMVNQDGAEVVREGIAEVAPG